MGSPEVSNFSVEYILRRKGAEETPGRSREGHAHSVRTDHWHRTQRPHPENRYPPQMAEPRRRSSSSSSSRSRSRSRTVFTESQTQQLELLFGRTEYPTPDEREELARSTGLPHEVIRVWFKNRRARRKNQNVLRSPNRNPVEEVGSGAAIERD
ncbi:homeobox protein MIXL1-like [Arapaima gigas]